MGFSTREISDWRMIGADDFTRKKSPSVLKIRAKLQDRRRRLVCTFRQSVSATAHPTPGGVGRILRPLCVHILHRVGILLPSGDLPNLTGW